MPWQDILNYSSIQLTRMNLSLTSPNRDIPSVFELKQNFTKCTIMVVATLKLYFQRCDGPERHQMFTVINDYYSYTKYSKFGIFCWNFCTAVPNQFIMLQNKCKVQSSNIFNWQSTNLGAIVSLQVKLITILLSWLS